jgi:malonate-semialdehyde dehydrogenase (acetylating) / methylmalonate-semialdehyde dehydrogenase
MTNAAPLATQSQPRTIAHWIGGAPREQANARTGEVFDPATGQVTGLVQLADLDVVNEAVAAAKTAFPAWRATPAPRRVAFLQELAHLLRAHTDELAGAISSEHGKVLADAAGELARGIEVVDLACSAPLLLKGEFSEQVAGGVDTYSLRQPLGVCAGITPFNFPAMVPLWMFPIALACGNTFVLKPSDRDPSASLLLADLVARAGVPDGVFNVVQGDKVAVDALLDHPDVTAVSFVGSTPVANYVYGRATAAGKRVQALGGAKNHMVVMPDADIERAADALTSAGFGSTGQRCMAIAAAVAVGEVADPLIEALRSRIRALRVGPATDETAEMGPLVSGEARDRVLSYVKSGVAAGADLVEDGRSAEVAGQESGYFVGPTLFDRVQPDMDVYRDEIFGPVLVILRVDTLDEALQLIDDCEYGNGAAIFTRSGAAARRFQSEVSAGMVGINVPIPVPVSSFSFGGWKRSLFGDTHLYGEEGFRFYTRAKVVTSRWPEDPAGGVNLRFPS